ncbi:MAG: DUF4827 domain-containing protein [Clostridium sp.]|nr:DUF4827 domain-containing protein [Prevotella sp.]MCM1428195.1 DUF4827 domain-containing protein [Clostridium sp.]MCM1475926.1 DUF4827 domain-containing protein [Muribaculaceae bacterium]
MNLKFSKYILSLSLIMVLLFSACSKSESYSNLLKDEERAVNWYLSGQQVCVEIPADSILLHGENAPYYKMNEEGTIYMKVLTPGDLTPENRPQINDNISIRYNRLNLRRLYEDGAAEWEGNSDDLAMGSLSIVYGSTLLPETTKLGQGLQEPLKFLGYNSRVMLIIKASVGPTDEQSQCIPYLYDIRYFKTVN